MTRAGNRRPKLSLRCSLRGLQGGQTVRCSRCRKKMPKVHLAEHYCEAHSGSQCQHGWIKWYELLNRTRWQWQSAFDPKVTKEKKRKVGWHAGEQLVTFQTEVQMIEILGPLSTATDRKMMAAATSQCVLVGAMAALKSGSRMLSPSSPPDHLSSRNWYHPFETLLYTITSIGMLQPHGVPLNALFTCSLSPLFRDQIKSSTPVRVFIRAVAVQFGGTPHHQLNSPVYRQRTPRPEKGEANSTVLDRLDTAGSISPEGDEKIPVYHESQYHLQQVFRDVDPPGIGSRSI
jgi:hypothetical protein